jgi:hypothetical protein
MASISAARSTPGKQGNEIDHRLAAPEDDRLASPDKEIAIAG